MVPNTDLVPPSGILSGYRSGYDPAQAYTVDPDPVEIVCSTLTFIDYHSQKLWVSPLKIKDHVLTIFMELHARVEIEIS